MKPTNKRGFSLLEIMVVLILIALLTAATGLTFQRSRTSTQVKTDAARTVSFLRNMWDLVRATGGALVLEPNFETGGLSYLNPRTGERFDAEFESDAQVVGIQLNNRLYNVHSNLGRVPTRGQDVDELDYDPSLDVIYVSEGRGLVMVAVIFAVRGDDEESYSHVTMSALNLVNGRGRTIKLEDGAMDSVTGDEPIDFEALANEEDEREAEEDDDD